MQFLEETRKGKYSHIRPFLWLKGEDYAAIQQEIEKIQQCGIREICLESRPHPDFCGEGWWKELDFILLEAEKRGMKVWILDDDKFPTGHANGGVARQPDKGKVYLAERHMDVYGPCKDGAVLVENFLEPGGELLGILAAPKPDGNTLAVEGEGIIDLTSRYQNGFVYWDVPPGPYRLFALFTTRRGGGREEYINLIDQESVQVLLEEVYEKHYQRYQKYFGTTLAGFFSDEPELGNVKGYPFDCTVGQKDIRLPWSKALSEILHQAWGDEFLRYLPALWYESGVYTKRVRTDYMEAVTKLVRDCFSKTLGTWCEAHGVEYIGHIIEDDNAHTRLGCSIGHYFREMEGQHMAGVDVVHHQIVPGFTEPVHQWIAGDRDGEFFQFGLAKLASSAAHIQPNKRGRALCEIFGNYGWAEGNTLMKWLTNHMLVRGINEFTPHAFSMQYPDRDCPPHFYARGNHPGFECFTMLMQYMNRAAHLLSSGVHLADAAILYHGESEWCTGEVMYFQKPGRCLMEQQLDYDVIPADVLQEPSTTVENGWLKIGREQYSCLILPYAQYLNRTVAEFILKNSSKGLKVFVVAGLPDADTRGQALPKGWEQCVQVVTLYELAEQVKNLEERDGFPRIISRSGSTSLRRYAVEHDNGIVVMYFNESVDEQASVTASCSKFAGKTATVYDPWQNQSRVFYTIQGELPLCLEPGEAVFICLNQEEQKDGRHLPQKEEVVSLSIDWTVSRAEVGKQDFTKEMVLKAGEPLPNVNGPDYWPEFVGFFRYEGMFCLEKREDRNYQLLLPKASDSVKILVNGQCCGVVAGFPARVDITKALQNRENHICLEVANTLVWQRKDGASTHLLIPPTGITECPKIECYQ